MLNLFASVFGRSQEAHATLPGPLLEQLTERAVDGTDPRMRIISGYAKALRQPIIHAANHVIELVDRLPQPLSLDPNLLRDSPTLATFLYSQAQAIQMLARDAALLEYRASKPATAAAITALLVVQRSEKHGFGYGQVGEQSLKDVPQTTVSFTQHHLLEPAVDEQDTRRGLKRRAFDQLLVVALAKITARKDERTELASRRALLRSKLEIMQRSGSLTVHIATDEQTRLQARMKEVEEKLAALGPTSDVLQDNLEVVKDVLANAEHHLWLEENTLYIDKLYVCHDRPLSSSPPIVCRDLHNSEGRQVTLQLVRLPFNPAINTEPSKE